jgi:hypothetical protein
MKKDSIKFILSLSQSSIFNKTDSDVIIEKKPIKIALWAVF